MRGSPSPDAPRWTGARHNHLSPYSVTSSSCLAPGSSADPVTSLRNAFIRAAHRGPYLIQASVVCKPFIVVVWFCLHTGQYAGHRTRRPLDAHATGGWSRFLRYYCHHCVCGARLTGLLSPGPCSWPEDNGLYKPGDGGENVWRADAL